MRLYRPDPGELVDRQTILTLKVEHIEKPKDGLDYEDVMPVPKGEIVRTVIPNPTKVDVHPFVDELELIRDHLIKDWIPSITGNTAKEDAYDALYDELLEVNRKLWDIEDEARVLFVAPKDVNADTLIKRKAELRDLTTEFNDKRASIVQKINELWKINRQEKLY